MSLCEQGAGQEVGRGGRMCIFCESRLSNIGYLPIEVMVF